MACVRLWAVLLLCACARASRAALCDCGAEVSHLEEELLSKTKLARNFEEMSGKCYKRLENLLLETDRMLTPMKKQLEMQEFRIAKVSELEGLNKNLQNELNSKDEMMKTFQDANKALAAQIELLGQRVEKCEDQVQPTRVSTSTRRYHNNPMMQRTLMLAIKSRDLAGVKSLIQGRINVNFRDETQYNLTPLIVASMYGNLEATRLLLQGGANVDDASSTGNTALHHAASGGYLEICRLLLGKAANADVLNNHGNTPTHMAAARGHLAVVKLLVQKGADVSLRNNAGDTPHDAAWKTGKQQVAQWLSSHA